MRSFFLLILSLSSLFAAPMKVPQEFYSGFSACEAYFDHYPLITDIMYRSISNHIVDQKTEWFDPSLVNQGDIVYLNIWYLEWFEKQVHDAIQYPYILITYDVGDWLPNPSLKKLLYDPKLATWFCRNIIFSYHPKLIQIPMGHNDRLFPDAPLIHLKEMILANKPLEKKHLLYMNHLPRPFGDRDKIVKLFEHAPYCFSRNHSGTVYGQISRKDYFEELADSQFVLSPYGLETDCVRTWEAFGARCIPIVEHTFLDPLFEGLPIVFVHKWTEINEPFLKKKAEELKNCTWERALFDPWRDLILETQRKVKRDDLSFAYLDATLFPVQDITDLLSILDGQTILIYRGFVSGMHALQLAKESPSLSKIHLCDPWLDQKTLRSFSAYLEDRSWTQNIRKIGLIPFQSFDTLFPSLNRNSDPVFLDLSFYRNSLMRDPNLKQFRHSLLKDLSDLYQAAAPHTLFCGNGLQTTYVQEVLAQFSEEYGRPMQRRGNFWFFEK